MKQLEVNFDGRNSHDKLLLHVVRYRRKLEINVQKKKTKQENKIEINVQVAILANYFNKQIDVLMLLCKLLVIFRRWLCLVVVVSDECRM